MSRVLDSKTHIVSTDIGLMVVTAETVVGYDVEDIIRDRAKSQGRILQLINAGKNADVNAQVGARTIKSIYAQNDTELPS